jgi:hypothetical protein
MGKKQTPSSGSSSVKTQSFVKGLIKDYNDSYFPDNAWSHAVNTVNATSEGDLGTLSNEQSNLLCASICTPGGKIHGRIHLFDSNWVVFAANDVTQSSEIGLFNEKNCTYIPITRDACLNFSTLYPITGKAKKNFDCSWQIYWADGRNPDRSMNIGDPQTWPAANQGCEYTGEWPGLPYEQECSFIDPDCKTNPIPSDSGIGCEVCVNKLPLALDCDKIRLARLVKTPCVKVSKGIAGGTLPNGSYYVVLAYSINGQKVTDYFSPSNTQSLFAHNNLAGSLDITIEDIDQDFFDEFELVLVSNIAQNTIAKRVGYYNTRVGSITLDIFNLELPTVPLEFIPIRTPIYEKSEIISSVNDYLLRLSPTTRLDFNYQPLANRIKAKWVAVKYPNDYYRKGGNKTGYLRDEIYSFWIRWVYETGEKSASYHIPGRPPKEQLDLGNCVPQGYGDLSQSFPVEDNIYFDKYFFEVYNTASVTQLVLPGTEFSDDGGEVLARGDMGYWQSTEVYPNKPNVWNTCAHPWSNEACTEEPEVNLCSEFIRHHKMPDNKCVPHFTTTGGVNNNSNNQQGHQYGIADGYVLLGVEFDNIRYPVDNDGIGIPGIVGYEILRGTREGNKTIVAKGILNNMREYTIDDDGNGVRSALYQNYPYNPQGTDFSLTTTQKVYNPCSDYSDPFTNSNVKYEQLTFHSPDTTFREPFLAETELKLYGELFGDVYGNFDDVPGHPKHKVVSDFAFIVSAIAGFGIAALAISGGKKKRVKSAQVYNLNLTQAGTTTGTILSTDIPPITTGSNVTINTTNAATTATQTPISELLLALFGFIPDSSSSIFAAQGNLPNTIGPEIEYEFEETAAQASTSAGGGAVTTFIYYWTQGADSVLKLIEAFLSYEQYALMYRSHGAYTVFDPGRACRIGNQRKLIKQSLYLDTNLQTIQVENFPLNPKEYTINNLFRNKCVVLDLNSPVDSQINAINSVGTCLGSTNSQYLFPDNTIQTLGKVQDATTFPFLYPTGADNLGNNVGIGGRWFDNYTAQFRTKTAVYYGALKYRIRNLYGQLDQVKQVVASPCMFKIGRITNEQLANPCEFDVKYSTGLMFGGDTYVGRYTEKNKFFYFYDWLYNLPDGTELDYTLKYMIQYPRFWGNFTGFDLGSFLNNLFSISAATDSTPAEIEISNPILPNDFHHFDRYLCTPSLLPGGSGVFNVKNAFFYLFNTGVRDFIVESEINVDQRDWDEEPQERFYDPFRYTDLQALFDTEIIKADNYYKYDYSLSITKLFNNYISWGSMQDRSYDPNISELCYTYYPNRVLYSLPQNLEAKKDFWYAFLANNYKEFLNKPNSINSIAKNGAIITFETDSPLMFQGVDVLETELGTKVTIGDGGLFSQPQQSIVNADIAFEYGSCQDRYSIISTPTGVYWISQSQGKIFRYFGGLKEISASGLRWWFDWYLPYRLTEDFPEYPFTDNPISGVGCQTIYDNSDQLVYFCKKDFKLKVPKEEVRFVRYQTDPVTGKETEVNLFIYRGGEYKLEENEIFEDASWTVSYDAKSEVWISYHDWHPDMVIPSRRNFYTTKDTGIWRHNYRTDSFCNFYNQDYRFEVEYPIPTGQTVNTLRSVEYILENYIYSTNGIDQFNVLTDPNTGLDFNFDHAVIYNPEQVSGQLILRGTPKNDIITRLQYPIINLNNIEVLFSKEENKYRFNQFWDITADRGEFLNPTIPGYAQRAIWDTSENGYDRVLNQNNLNYSKDPLQRKKFRHYLNFMNLYREKSGNVKMIFKISNTKNLLSPR